MSKNPQKKSRKKERKSVSLFHFLIIFGLLLTLESAYFFTQNELSDRLPFGIKVADTEFGLMEAKRAIVETKILASKFSKQPISFEFNGKVLKILPKEIDLNFEIERKIGLLKNQLINFGKIQFPINLNERRLRRLLLAKFPELEYSPTDAKVFLGEDKKLNILQEKSGRKTDFIKISESVKERVGKFSDKKIEIESKEIPPQVFAKNLEPFREELSKIIAEKLILKKTEYERFEIDLGKRIGWFDFQKDKTSHVFLKKRPIEKFVKNELGPLAEEIPSGVSILQTPDGKIEFKGVAKTGKKIDIEELFGGISTALETGIREVNIPFQFLEAPLKIAKKLQDSGIHELVGESMTNYEGSPMNREHNIRVAAARLNGLLIPAKKEFSFNQSLGFINTHNGYRSELIIVDGDVTPEIGGGVCQVSTTFFRTALYAGLPITRRKPHSLKIEYYRPPGLDAAIYPGLSDTRFLNDTDHPILVQTAVEGTKLYVNFFGTKDGRNVKIAGPFYPDGNQITDLSLSGMRMFWTREIKKVDEEKISEKYNSSYRYAPKH